MDKKSLKSKLKQLTEKLFELQTMKVEDKALNLRQQDEVYQQILEIRAKISITK